MYEQRAKALATPSIYNKERKAEWDKLTAVDQTTYNDTVGSAELAARRVYRWPNGNSPPLMPRKYATQKAILEANFPSGNQALAIEAGVRLGLTLLTVLMSPWGLVLAC